MKVFTILSIDNWLLYSTAGQEAGYAVLCILLAYLFVDHFLLYLQ